MTREENMRDDLQATRERQERLRSEVRHLNQKQKELRDENRHLSGKVAKLQDGVAGALIAMEEGDAERARVLLEHALGLPVLERSPDESPNAGEDPAL
jgi:predicted  nucleic acid-binding Zn-ribbon protein